MEDTLIVVDPVTGDRYPCKYNPTSQHYEIIRPMEIVPRYSKFCTDTLNMVLYARNYGTNMIHRYKYQDGKVVEAGDCVCEGCGQVDQNLDLLDPETNKIGYHEFFESLNGTPLICLHVSWDPSKTRGYFTIFVDARGNIGRYRGSKNGFVLVEQVSGLKLLPRPQTQLYNHELVLKGHSTCSHLDTVIFWCEVNKNPDLLQVIFDRFSLTFQLVHCQECRFPNDSNSEELKNLFLVNIPPNMAVWTSEDGMLRWGVWTKIEKSYEGRRNRLEDLRMRSMTEIRSLRLHYQSVQTNYLNTIEKTSRQVFTEKTFGPDVHWMVARCGEINPYTIQTVKHGWNILRSYEKDLKMWRKRESDPDSPIICTNRHEIDMERMLAIGEPSQFLSEQLCDEIRKLALSGELGSKNPLASLREMEILRNSKNEESSESFSDLDEVPENSVETLVRSLRMRNM